MTSERPKGAARLECWALKLRRRVMLFDPFQVRLWTLLESSPRVIAIANALRFGATTTISNLSIFGSRSAGVKCAGLSHRSFSQPGLAPSVLTTTPVSGMSMSKASPLTGLDRELDVHLGPRAIGKSQSGVDLGGMIARIRSLRTAPPS